MKTLNLEQLGVQKMDAVEVVTVTGGDEPAYGIGYIIGSIVNADYSWPDFGGLYDYAMAQWDRR